MKHLSIAIDGPAGSGKSTIAKMISKKLGIVYVDTGAMYRAIALYFIRQNSNLNDTNYIVRSLDSINISLNYSDGQQQLFLNGEDVSHQIRSVEVSNGVSNIAKILEVRQKLVVMQRALSNEQSIIMDGRDIGTHVLPNATLKIYLVADIDERVKRRYNDYLNHGENSEIEKLKQDMINRDYQDSNREASPLRKAEDAIEIDTTALTIEDVCEKIVSYL